MLNKNMKENKLKRLFATISRSIIKKLSKTTYVKLQYKYITHHKLNLNNPQRYTEKLQHLRLFEYPLNDKISECAGRVTVRDYIKQKGLEEILIPCLGVFNSFDQIDFSKLPNAFVMKCSHASGYNYIVKNKANLNINKLRKLFNKWLKSDYGKKTVEPHYSKIKPQIIIEELLVENSLNSPIEYKIHCFNGKAKYLYVVTGRGNDIKYNNYYIDWTNFDRAQFNGWETSCSLIEKPSNFDRMVEISESLSKNFPFVRIDLYNINGKIYFGEMTFTPAKGTLLFSDDNVDFEIGDWLKI